jgi:hypothetical protein
MDRHEKQCNDDRITIVSYRSIYDKGPVVETRALIPIR